MEVCTFTQAPSVAPRELVKHPLLMLSVCMRVRAFERGATKMPKS